MTFGLSWFFRGHLDLPFREGNLRPLNNHSSLQRSRLFSFCGLVAFSAGARCCCHIENLPDHRVRPFREGNPEELDTTDHPEVLLGSPREGRVEEMVSEPAPRNYLDVGSDRDDPCDLVSLVPSVRGVRPQKWSKWQVLRMPSRSEFDSTNGLRTSQKGLPFWGQCCRYRIGNNRRGKETDVPSWLDLKLVFPSDTENTCWHCTFWKQTQKNFFLLGRFFIFRLHVLAI